ncbi:glycan-binding surface protein [Chitinophaga sp. RAB17]|uniref:glycan-binding surface protein n=1 Tax=Chitinophaga sp. RAB17 TaxID=3233049 RepID=UPI003F90BFE3
MNKVTFHPLYKSLSLFTLAVLFTCIQSSCKKDTTGAAPEITSVRNYAASPADTLVETITTGQWVVLIGHHLKDAVQISFNGVPATINSVMFSDTSAAVLVPAVIPFPSVPAETLNTIRYITRQGATTYTFSIAAPPPSITAVSNENANEGDSVYISGLNLFFIKQLSFAGTVITKYKEANDGTSVGFVLPKLTQSGPVVVTTKSGTFTTPYNVNDVKTGVLCNFDDINTYDWGGDILNSSIAYPGNKGSYAVLKYGALSAGDGSWWGGGRSINMKKVQWLPVDSLNVPVDNYALKFEINVPVPWSATSIYAIKGYSFDYQARYEPWQGTNGAVTPFTTKGWNTVTIPLSLFRTNDGKGTAASDLTTLLGETANGEISIQTKNYSGTATTSGLQAAIDNIRVVKIK